MMRKWNPTAHRELKVLLHVDLPGSPSPENFSRLRNAPDSGSVRALVSKTQKLASDLQISNEEAKKFTAGGGEGGAIPGSVASFWMNLLSARARAFASGGSAAQPPYDHTGQAVRPNEEFNGLLREQPKIKQQFSSFLGGTGIGHGGGGKAELYWELLDVDSQGVLSLGATYNRGAGSGGYQVADAFYYASGGYYVTLALYQMWPVTVDGKPVHARLARRFRFRGAARDVAWDRKARFRIGDDEKHYQSRDFISPRHIISAVVASPDETVSAPSSSGRASLCSPCSARTRLPMTEKRS